MRKRKERTGNREENRKGRKERRLLGRGQGRRGEGGGKVGGRGSKFRLRKEGLVEKKNGWQWNQNLIHTRSKHV